MKKALSIIASVFLVVACAITGAFASDFNVQSGWNDYGTSSTVIFPDNSETSYGEFTYEGDIRGQSVDIQITYNSAVPQNTFIFPNVSENANISYTNLVNCYVSGYGLKSTGEYTDFSFTATWGSNYNQQTVVIAGITFTGIIARLDGSSIGKTVSLNGGPFISTVTNTYSVVLPYGNALAISSDSDFIITRRAYSVRNTTYNYQKYVRASDDFSYRVNGAYQGIAPVSAFSGNFGVAVYGSNNVLDLLIPWQPVNQNIMGRATEYNFYAGLTSEQVSVSSGNAFLIWYPYYANNQDTSKLNEVPLEMSITVTHSSPIYFTTYPITGSTSSSGEDSYISNTASSTDSGSSSQTDDGDGNVTVTFDNAPTAGGNHGQAPINDNNSILGVLSNLQNTLLGLFNKAIDGIHNLITLGSSFLQSVQVMFSWLPAELLVIITSGFVILLTIGVLKTLWR